MNEGVLTAVLNSGPNWVGNIGHESEVSIGSWSFDLFFPEEKEAKFNIFLSCDQDFKFGFGFYSMTMDNTIVALRTASHGIVSPGKPANLGRRLTGWNHIDVTRDASGNSKLYLNGVLVVEFEDELSFSPYWFYIGIEETGPVIDNLVVRDRILDFSLAETD